MSYPQQSNFMFFGSDSSNDNTLTQAQSMGAAGAYQHGHLGMASDVSGASAAAAAAAVAAAAGSNSSGVNAYFVNNSHALMAAAAAGHAGMYQTAAAAASMIDTQQQQQHHHHHHQRSGSLSSATVAAAATGGAIGAEHRRSPSGSVRSGVGSIDHAQRRATHNAIERARRESLNGQFQDLASAVPSLTQVRRPSKATIVEKSLEHIRSFRHKMETRDSYIAKLRMRNLELHDEVNRLRKQLGLEPLDNDAEDLPETISEAPEDQLQPASQSAAAVATGVFIQPHPPHKRRQQSLDLGAVSAASGSGSSGRPLLRVQTSNISKHTQRAPQTPQALLAPAATTTVSAVGGDHSSGDASPMSSSASPLNISPLSAPVISHTAASASQFPFSTMQATSEATAAAAVAAAAAAAAMQQQLFSSGIVTTMAQQPLHQQCIAGATTTAGGYAMAPQPAGLGLIDMSKLSEVFSANTATNAASASIMSMSMPANDLASSASPGMSLEGSPSISMAQ
ncbi:hypothetical protein EV179_006222 [Coemansia sp. RSA 487]|nr:hypothetical protein EV179_006222 [Coemansia sp. RSA 487]